jgi:PAS domain S-box-containing protein
MWYDNRLIMTNKSIGFETIFEQSPVSTQVFAPDGLTLRVNKAWEKLWGVKLEQIKGYNILQDNQLVQKGIMKYIQQGFAGKTTRVPAIKYEPPKTVNVKGAVAYRWVSAIIYPIKDETGRIREVVLQHEDITKQKESEEKLWEANQQLQAVIHSSPLAVYVVDPQGIVLMWNKVAERMFGWTAEEAVGKPLPIVQKEKWEEFQNLLKHLRSGKSFSKDLLRQRKDGSQIHVTIAASPMLDEEGKVRNIVAMTSDITDRIKAEATLKDSEERLRLALDAGNIGVWDWDIVNNKIEWTEKVYEIHGVRKDQLIGGLDNYSQELHPEDAERVKLAIHDALAGKSRYDIEFRIITPTGETKWVHTSADITRDKDGKPIRMLGATQDITARKNFEKQKDDFMGIVSHELRTPVTSLKAFAQVLHKRFHKQGLNEAAVLLAKMDNQVDKLSTLIQDLLDVTRLEGGRLKFQEDYFSFDDLVDEVIEELQRTTEHRIIKEGATKQEVFGDRERIGQVLTNFLTNAIKYSPDADKIIVSVMNGKKEIKASVQDFGVGIPEEQLPYVFDRFYRVNSAKHATVPGIGLGLYIASEIIKRQNGTIWAESIEGKGSTFGFTLPLATKTKKQARN